MEPGAQGRSLGGFQAEAQKSCDHTGQNIAAATLGHSGISAAVQIAAILAADQSPVSFEQNRRICLAVQLHRPLEPGAAEVASKAQEFSLVRR